MAKLDRLLNLTAALLDTTVPLTAEQIRERVPDYPPGGTAFHRAFERDKDDLRELGIPLETVSAINAEQPGAAYIIDEQTYALPDPGLTPEELASLHMAQTAALLEGYESEDLEFAFRKLGGTVSVVEGGLQDDGPGSLGGPLATIPVSPALNAMFQATLDRRQVEFGYLGGRRHLKPYRLQFERGHWYLSGYDVDRKDQRSFRLDRVEGEVTSGPPRSFKRPDAPRGVMTRPWEIGDAEAVSVKVLVDREPAQAMLVEFPELPVTETSEDGSVVVELAVSNRVGLWHFMVSLLDRAEILEPAEMRHGLIDYLSSFTEGGVE